MPQVVNLTESDEEQEAADVIDLAEDKEPQAVVTTAQDAANTVRAVAARVALRSTWPSCWGGEQILAALPALRAGLGAFVP